MTRFAALLFALLLALPARAADPPETPDAIYGHAMHGLLIAHNYERAGQQLKYLLARDPGNRKYHLALGCAEADRAASLGYAVYWALTLPVVQSQYAKDVQKWQADQRDPKSPNYGDPAPTPPPAGFTVDTKDDDYPFVLPVPEARTRIATLTQAALEEWKRALTLSKTPAARAEAEWVQGKGMELLIKVQVPDMDASGEPKPPPAHFHPLVTHAMALAALTAATKDAPNNALYWQSLGDALYAPDDGDYQPHFDKAQGPYQKSLALQPVNATLWFQMYSINSRYDNKQPAVAKDALLHTISSDPDNAYTHYLLAGLLFQGAHYNDVNDKPDPADKDKALHAAYDPAQQAAALAALAQMEQGSTAFHFLPPRYDAPYPPALSAFVFWRKLATLGDMGFMNNSKLRELARAACGYARVSALQGDRTDAERATRATIGMGLKLCGDWPVKDDPFNGVDVITPLVGMAIVNIGYRDLIQAETDMGNIMAAQQAQAEQAAFKTRTDTYRAAIRAGTASYSIFDYY